MSDVEGQIEEPIETPDEEVEIVVGAPEAPKPEVVTLTPAEYAALKANGDSAQAIQKGIEGLADRLSAPQAPVVAPANAPTQTPEEFYAEHADDLFDKDKAPKVLAQYNKMLMEREYGPMFNAQAAALVGTRKELLEARDPLFKQYANEVEALVKAQPPSVQLQPNVYELAWANIREKHRVEIEQAAVDAKVNAAVESKLKELGIDPTKPAGRPDAYQNSAARGGGSGPATSTKRTIRVPDQATMDRLTAEARKRGLDPVDYLKRKGY